MKLLNTLVNKIRSFFVCSECSEPGPFVKGSPTSGSADRDIKILFEGQEIGAAQSMTWSPGPEHAQNPELNLTRIRLRSADLRKIFIRGFVHSNSQKSPLYIRTSNVEFVNCWMTSSLYSYHAGDWVILESVKFEAEKQRDV